MHTHTEPSSLALADDAVDHMIELAERLRVQNGGVLDDEAILAVSEATGTPVDHVRLALRLRAQQEKKSFTQQMRIQFLSLDADVRRYVGIGAAAVFASLLTTLYFLFGGAATFGLIGMLALMVVGAGLYGISQSRDLKTALVGGAIGGGGYVLAGALFDMLIRIPTIYYPPALLLVGTGLGVASGALLHRLNHGLRKKLGMADPVQDRQQLLRKLVELQDQLREGERTATFLSVDIVGSTRMKEVADALAVEFTFNEYHQFVARVAEKNGGKVHSTAGDGVICSFESPRQAYMAARNLQTGVLELNAFRNKIGVPIVLRCGVHCGTIVTGGDGDVSSVNFAHVIDVAAHLQKVCPEGAVAVSEAAAVSIGGSLDAIGPIRVRAESVNAAVWRPRTSVALDSNAGSPQNGTPLAPNIVES